MLNLALGFLALTLIPPVSRAEPAPAPEPLSLPAAIELARRNSPDLRKAELVESASSWGKLEALSEHLPHLSVRGTHFFSAKYSNLHVLFGGGAVAFPSAFPQTEVELEASLLLFDGLGSINRYRASLLEHEATELELSHSRFALEERIGTRFNQALAAQQFAKVADQNIETLEQHLQLARASVRVGFSTNVDVLRIEAQLEEARAERILAYDNVVTARRSLNEAIGVEGDERPLQGELPIPDPKRVPADLALDVTRREDIQAQTRREGAQDRLSAASKAFWFPRISLFGVEQGYKFGSFDPAILPTDFQNAYSYGVRLSWNLFDGGASIARQNRASDAAAIATEELRKQLLASANEFDLLKRKYIYNTALFGARKRAVEKSSESVRLATVGVRAGTKTNSEALDAELELFRARAGVIRARMEAADALANLELALGHRL